MYAHAGQLDKAGKPYILHPLAVMLNVVTERSQTVAVLHDVVEDTNITLDYIRELFGNHVADAVDAITHRKPPKSPEVEPYEAYILRCKQNETARLVKIVDLEHNLSRMAALSAECRERLIPKYQRALEVLRQSGV